MNWGKSIVLFFIIFLSLMLAFVVFSLNQHHDLVTDDYYEQGASFSDQMVIDQRSKLYTDSIRLQIQNGMVLIEISQHLEQNGRNFEVCFYRPSDKKLDVTRSFLTDTTQIVIKDANLQTGRYIAKFKWTMADSVYMLHKDIYVD